MTSVNHKTLISRYQKYHNCNFCHIFGISALNFRAEQFLKFSQHLSKLKTRFSHPGAAIATVRNENGCNHILEIEAVRFKVRFQTPQFVSSGTPPRRSVFCLRRSEEGFESRRSSWSKIDGFHDAKLHSNGCETVRALPFHYHTTMALGSFGYRHTLQLLRIEMGQAQSWSEPKEKAYRSRPRKLGTAHTAVCPSPQVLEPYQTYYSTF